MPAKEDSPLRESDCHWWQQRARCRTRLRPRSEPRTARAAFEGWPAGLLREGLIFHWVLPEDEEANPRLEAILQIREWAGEYMGDTEDKCPSSA